MSSGMQVLYKPNAVRLTHVPTGVTVEANQYRSQHTNRDAAYKRLRSLLAAGGKPSALPLRASYTLPEDQPYPDDLTEHRRNFMTEEEYRRKLAAHDWLHEASEDHSAWKAGRRERAELLEAQKQLDPDWVIWKEYEKK